MQDMWFGHVHSRPSQHNVHRLSSGSVHSFQRIGPVCERSTRLGCERAAVHGWCVLSRWCGTTNPVPTRQLRGASRRDAVPAVHSWHVCIILWVHELRVLPRWLCCTCVERFRMRRVWGGGVRNCGGLRLSQVSCAFDVRRRFDECHGLFLPTRVLAAFGVRRFVPGMPSNGIL